MAQDTVKVEVCLDIWQKNHQVLIASKENARELLDEHENNKQQYVSIKKHDAIGMMYEREIREINALLEYSVENAGVPF